MSETYELETVEENAVCPDLDLRIRAHLEQCFPDSPEKFQIRRVWHNVSPEYTILAHRKLHDDSTQLVGHVAVVVRTITTTWNWRYNVASIQGVSVAEQCRHAGLALRMLALALEEARRRSYDYAVLFCKEPLVSFYEKQGWRLTDDSVIMRNEQDCPIKMRSNCPMYKELTEKPFPEGPVDVHNPEQVGMAKRGVDKI